MCPHGFDPTSTLSEAKKLRLRIAGGSGPLQGKLVLSFHSHAVELEAPLEHVTSEACTAIFRRFQNLADVGCERTEFKAPSTATYEITLNAFPVYPIMNNLYYHNGDPKASDFWCDTSGVQLAGGAAASGIACAFESISSPNVKHYAVCSNHGVCDDRSGVCTCADGFYGDHCGNNQDNEDIQVAASTGPFFKGNVLRVSAKRAMATDFNLIKVDVAAHTVFSMNGEGDTALHRGSFFLKDGDLVVQNGQMQIHRGGSLALDHANVQIKNGHILLQQSLEHAATQGARKMALLQLELTKTSLDFLNLLSQGRSVLRVSGSGSTIVDQAGLEVLNGGVKIQRGGLSVLSDGIVVANGGLELHRDSLRIRTGRLEILDGSAQFVASSVSGQTPVLSLERQTPAETAATATAPVLQLHANRMDEVLVQATGSSQRTPVFEVKGSGQTVIHAGGLQVASGGVHIESGGQTIKSGGLRIESGGLHIESGSFTTKEGFEIEGGLGIRSSAINGAALRLASTNAQFAGPLLDFNIAAQEGQASPFRLMQAVTSSNDQVFSVDSTGRIETTGDIMTRNKGKIVSNGALVSEAQVVFAHIKVLAGDDIVVPNTHSYVKVTSDGQTRANRARIDSTGAYAGQLLVLQNEDEESLAGSVSVQSAAAAMMVYDGASWRPLTAASFDTSRITGVQQFEAANDLNMGDIKLTVSSVQVGGQRAGYVAVYGKGGELTQHEGLAFDTATGLLSVHQLNVHLLKGKIDMSESELHRVEIVGGHISNVNMTGIEMVEVNGELFVESGAFFGAGITVDGQVMGSGAYVDASDSRFKQNVTRIEPQKAAQMISELEGVAYSYRQQAFPDKKFSSGRELGFLAQDVERVVPEVVTQDADGFKYVAYARLMPVVVEAVKYQQQQADNCESDVERLREEVEKLRQTLAQQQTLLDKMFAQLSRDQATA